MFRSRQNCRVFHARRAASLMGSSEFELIEWIRARAAGQPRLTLGIGDDAAAYRMPADTDCLVALDMLMEGVHFTLPPATAAEIGRKALAVNLSDLAAMAGRPLAAFVGAAYPRRYGDSFARDVQGGVQLLADEFGVAVAGGDTNVWDGPLVISVTVLGEATGTGPVRRAGAQVGDWIMVTGQLGGSLRGRHLSFRPRVDEALALHVAVALHSMIDVSDGLVADLNHILEESHVGAVLTADSIPISDDARLMNDGRTPLERALGDGEDFELLFTVAAEDGHRLLNHAPIGVPLAHIGEIVPGKGCELIDAAGQRRPVAPAGWRHTF
jgi:thiamine-monophosphate kinase